MGRNKLHQLLVMSLLVSVLLTGCGGSSGSSYSSSDDYYDSGITSGIDSSADAYTNSVSGWGAFTELNDSEEEVMVKLEDSYKDYDEEEFETKESSTETKSETDDTSIKEMLNEKLIYSCDISLETKNFVQTMESLNSLLNEYGIIIESEYYGNDSYGWYRDDYTPSACQRAELKLRIPSTKYHEFVDRTGELGHVVSKNSVVENLTSTYRDNETRLRTLREKRSRLESFLGQAETVTEVIELENSIEQVNYEIEKLESSNMTIDLGVMYSYITIDIEEVGEYTTVEPVTKTFGEELIEAFKDSWEDLVDLVQGCILALARLSIVAIIPMIILTVIIVVCVKILFKKDKKLKNKSNKPNIESIVNKNIDDNTEE